MFEDEIKALGDEGVVDEFESYFSNLVGDVEENNRKYSKAMKELEELLDLERETERIKRKVADFTVDYDEDLVSLETWLVLSWGEEWDGGGRADFWRQLFFDNLSHIFVVLLHTYDDTVQTFVLLIIINEVIVYRVMMYANPLLIV